MERTERYIIAGSLVALAVLFAAVLYASQVKGIEVPDCITGVEPYKEGSLQKISDNHYQWFVVARMWNFEPAEITIPAGATVDIYLVSKDVVHGFQILGTNVNLMAVPGAIAYQRHVFNKKGTYDVLCHEYCGVGHQQMHTKIIVQ